MFDILLIITMFFFIILFFVSIYTTGFEFSLYFKFFCKKLNIDKHFQKRLDEKYYDTLYTNFIVNKCKKTFKETFKETIMRCYSIMVMEDIRLYKYDNWSQTPEYFHSYANSREIDIEKLKTLLNDYQYKNNKFLFQNIIRLGQTLKEPFMVIDNINKLDISEAEKVKEINCIEAKIFEIYDNFFHIVDKLYIEYSISNETKIISEKPKMFDSLDSYNNSLINMVEDIDKKQLKLN